MKRTPLRKVSKKRAKQNRAFAKVRQDFRLEMERCCVCRRKNVQGVHEIVGGGMRVLTSGDRYFWLACCNDCHREVLQYMAKPCQLALKRRYDKEWYSLERFNAAYRNPKSNAVTEADVDAAEHELP